MVELTDMVGMVFALPFYSSTWNKCEQAIINACILQSLTGRGNEFWDVKESCYSIYFLLDQ